MWRQYTCYFPGNGSTNESRCFFSLKPSLFQGESSLKISARWVRHFGGVREQTNKQTHKLTHWYPIAFIEWFVYLLLFFPVSLIESIMYLELSIVWYLLSVWMLLDSWRTDWGCKSFNTSHCRKKNWVNTNLGNRNIS